MRIMILFLQRVQKLGECLAEGKDYGHVLHAVPCRKPVGCSAATAPAATRRPTSWQSAEEYVLDQEPHCSRPLPASSGCDEKDSKVSPGTFSNCRPSTDLTFDDTFCSTLLINSKLLLGAVISPACCSICFVVDELHSQVMTLLE